MAGLFVTVGQNGQRLFSENGMDWKGSQTGKEGESYRVVAFGNGSFVAAGSYGGNKNIFAVTSDGEKWETAQSEAKNQKTIRGLGFHAGTFYGIGGDPGSVGASKPFVSTSVDGLSWSEARDIGGKHMIRRLAFGNGLIVGVGDRGRRVASSDGQVWKDAPDVKAIDTLVDVAFGGVSDTSRTGGGRFVGVGLNSLRMTSEDGLTWTHRQVGEEGEHLNSILWAGDRFVAIGIGVTYFSPDGVTWQRQPNQDAPFGVAFGNGAFVGTNWKGRILHSTDAVAWQQVYKCANHVDSVAFGTP